MLPTDFLNYSRFARYRFLISLNSDTVQRIETLCNTIFSVYCRRLHVLIKTSNSLELLTRIWIKDHFTSAFSKKFRMLTLGWLDGHTLLPLNFVLLGFIKTELHGSSQEIDKRSSVSNGGKKLCVLPRSSF